MRGKQAKTWARYLIAQRAFEAAARALLSAHLPVVPVKGIGLARWIYADIAERPFVDVDLLISRREWAAARSALLTLGPALYDSRELGEFTIEVKGVHVELHAEVGRLEVTDFCSKDFIARSTIDDASFGFPVARLDDVDHLLLIAVETVRDGFVYANAHIPGDLERLLVRSADRIPILLDRARSAGFSTGLYCVAEWMGLERRSAAWKSLLGQIGPMPWRAYPAVLARFRRLRRPPWEICVLLGCLSHDRIVPRTRAVGRLLRRNAVKLCGRTPR